MILTRDGVLLGLEQFLLQLFLLDILVDICAPERYLDCALTLTASGLLDMKWKFFWLFLHNRGPKLLSEGLGFWLSSLCRWLLDLSLSFSFFSFLGRSNRRLLELLLMLGNWHWLLNCVIIYFLILIFGFVYFLFDVLLYGLIIFINDTLIIFCCVVSSRSSFLNSFAFAEQHRLLWIVGLLAAGRTLVEG